MIQTKQAAEAVETLAEKLSVPAQHLWAVLVRQAPIEAVQSLVWLGVMGLITWLWWKAVRWVAKDDAHYDWDVLAGITGFLLVIGVFVTISNAVVGVGYLFNPEYFAIDRVLKALKD